MSTVQQLLDHKGNDVQTINAGQTVYQAIRAMAEHNIGSIVVTDNDDKPVGIFTERHYAREVFLQGRASPTTPISDIMENEVICAKPSQTVQECMAVMTNKRVRHLPVMDGGEMVGLVSIGDLVKSTIDEQQFTIDQLELYIRS